MKYDVIINGRVLGLPLNGIPRYAMEICRQLDQYGYLPFTVAIVVPAGTSIQYQFRKIKLIELPNTKAWDFTAAEGFAKERQALYINLASKGSIYKKSISMLYDIRPLVYGDGKKSLKTIKTKTKFFLAYKLSVLNAVKLVTLTEFCKNEIERHSKRNDIEIAGCGWEHMQELSEDESVFTAFPAIKRHQYFLSVSSIAPHKNFQWIINNAKYNSEMQYVIVGKTDPRLWEEDTNAFSNNIIYLGFQSDERVKALIKSAKALLFPSLYEGFGIPPLEALSCGTPAIVSDIPVMREIFHDSVTYIDACNPFVNLKSVDYVYKYEKCKQVLEKYTWKNAADKWVNIITEVLNHERKNSCDF